MLDISNFPWTECTMTENRTLYMDDSLSLKRSKRNTGNHRFEFELVTVEMPMSQGRGIKAQLSAAVDDTLVFIHPRLSFAQGVEPAQGIECWGGANAGDKTIEVSGSALNWSLMAGDYIQFDNDTKVYEVAEDVPLSNTIQTVKLTSELRNAVTGGSTITMNSVGWHLVSNGAIEVNMNASDNQDMELTLIAVEKL